MEELDLNPRIVNALLKAGLKIYEDVLQLSSADISRLTKLSHADIVILQTAVSEEVYRQPKLTARRKTTVFWLKDQVAMAAEKSSNVSTPALDLLNGNCLSKFTKCKLGIGCPVLDQFLNGGVLSQGITEITGESATGKTQLCLQLCLNVQMRVEDGGLNSGAVYVCTEDVFPSRRLQQLIGTFHIRHQIDKAKQFALGEKIFVEHVAEKDQLEHCISHRIPVLLEKGLVKLIVIDSVAALFRSEFEAHEAFQRAKSLQRFGAQLHQLANKYNIPVICVNQVTANINTQSSSENSIKPALGLAWSNQVQTRLMLKRMPYKLPATSHSPESSNVPNTSYEIPVRSLEVIFSPHLPKDTTYFVVDADGVRGLR